MHGSPVMNVDAVVGMATVARDGDPISFTRISPAVKEFIESNQYRERAIPRCISGQA